MKILHDDIYVENKVINAQTENEICEIENKETIKQNVLEKYKNSFALFFVIFTVGLHLGCLIFIAKVILRICVKLYFLIQYCN